MWSFKSIIKQPVVASTLAILIATPILKFTGNLPLVWNWLKIWVVRLTHCRHSGLDYNGYWFDRFAIEKTA